MAYKMLIVNCSMHRPNNFHIFERKVIIGREQPFINIDFKHRFSFFDELVRWNIEGKLAWVWGDRTCPSSRGFSDRAWA